jgi:TonB family protein
LPRPPLVLQSAHPSLLVTWGFWQSKVILPAAAPTWAEDRIRIVLGHELAHIRRRDWLLQIAAELVRCAYWFNPTLWIGCRRLRQESEQACDDAVLQLGVDGRSYATHLLDLARAFRAQRRVWFPAPAIARRSSLERRISAMLNSRLNREPVTPFAAVAVLIALLGITIPIAGFEAFAQSRFATVSGSITDQKGGVLADATIVLSNVNTKAKQEVRTNQTGYFEIVGLPAGDYALEARFIGFEPFRENVAVGVGESLQRNITLQIGEVQETISVRSQGGSNVPVPRSPRAANRPRVGSCGTPGAGGCISPPLKVKDVRPEYPASLVDSGIRGVVALEGIIGTDGRMKDLRVVSSPHPELDRLALEAVGQWEFEPTTLNGQVVETRITTFVYFDVAAPPPPPPPPPPPQ